MLAGGRFGGHIVQGHVDGTARVESIKNAGGFSEMTFSADGGLMDEMVARGSVAVDGVSLTVARMDERGFTVNLIPTTLAETTLGRLRAGGAVNIETDIVVKAVKRQLEKMLPGGKGLTVDKLRELGF